MWMAWSSSLSLVQHMIDFEEVFEEIHKYDMRLIPKKCTFAVGDKKLLGFMITHHGIKPNPNKCTTILENAQSYQCQRSSKTDGRLASLFGFLLKLLEKARPFYRLLKKTKPFLWDEDCEQAFLAFKKTIVTHWF